MTGDGFLKKAIGLAKPPINWNGDDFWNGDTFRKNHVSSSHHHLPRWIFHLQTAEQGYSATSETNC
jgi:hypothetical protein